MDKNKKKKVYIISSIVGAVVTFAVVGFLVSTNGETEKVSTPKVEVKNEKADKNVSYEGINGLDYKVEKNQVSKLADGTYELKVDIVSSATFSNDDLSTLQSKIFELAKKESKKDIKHVVVSISDGKEVITTISADYSKEKPVVKATHYQSIKVPELKEREIGENEDPFAEDDGNIDAFQYDVKDVVEEGEKLTLEIVATGDSKLIADFIIGFVQVQRDLSPSVKTYAINIYGNEDALKAKAPKYKYDGQMLTYEELLSAIK